jgi:2,3-dihydroxybenzoate decarboxylase
MHWRLCAQFQSPIEQPLSFANGVNLHIVGLISNGVFARIPNSQGYYWPFE